ncbi:MAG TPA: hypothetical protein VJZ26_14530 [Blastocatellia bacterium]|nr:hypothetical protein [Blastocatellia bacterium]
MADLIFKGNLDLRGLLTLKASGGKVKVDGDEMLVELLPSDSHDSSASPVVMPPPPAPPADPGTKVVIISSFNKTVTAGGKPVVVLGMLMQGNTPMWPGMVLPSQKNTKVKVNGLPINVAGDKGVVFPSGGSVSFSKSGQ